MKPPMKHLCTTLAIALAAVFSASAKTFDWPIGSPAAGARQFTAYHGETVRFNLLFGGAMTNLAPVCIYYQTNGMGKAEWFGPVPGTVFHPTNDCGAASYRFFILCNDPDGINYTANGSLRMLDSPGFIPNELELPRRVIDFSTISSTNAPWALQSEIEDIATNAAVVATSRIFRRLDDDLVYEPLGMGDFEWSSNDRPDIIAALGTTQPYPGYEYDGYTEWHMDFYIGPTSYWCYAWAPTDSPEVEFSFDGWYWDEDTYEERYDYGTFTGRRQAMGYDITDPIDRFARQRDTTALYAGLATVSNLLVGETKVLRTGEPGQLGTGWGYIQSRIDDERRYWRIRVPKITVQGLGPYSASWVSSYTASNGAAAQLEALRCPTKSVTMRTSGTTTNYYTGTATHSGIAANLLQMSPDWQDFNYTLRRTMGSYAADRVVAASYRLGALGGTNGQYVAGYEIGSTAQSSNHKPSFTISLDTNALLAAGFVERTVAGAMTYYRATEPIEFCVTSYVHVGTSNYGAVDVTNRFSATVNGVGFWIPQTNESWNGTSPYFTLPVYYDFDFDLEALCSSVDEQTYYYSYTGYTNIYWSIATNYTVQLSARHAMMDQSLTVRYPSTVSSSDFAFTEYMDVFAAYYKVVTTLDPYSHMYYDPGMDATFRISVYNGVFYAEKVIDGDWRDYQGEIPPQSITNNPEQ